MADDIVGSHEKAKNGYGQNGSPQSSSLLPGQTKPNIPDVSPPTPDTANANASDDDKRLAAISGHPVKHHDGLPPRSVDSGSPGGKIPTANVRKSRTDGVARPVKR